MAVFISYRRDETEGDARALYNRLAEETDPSNLFLDFEAISAGDDWSARISDTLDKVQAVLVVIGPRWLDIMQVRAGSGKPDFVRREIAASLVKNNVRVIPVTVKGATLPDASVLPDDVKALVARNAIEIRGSAWTTDAERLIKVLRGAGALPASRRSWWLRTGAACAGLAVIVGAVAIYLGVPQKIRCQAYADGAVKEYNIMKSKPRCARGDDPRWQSNLDLHYGWCLSATEIEVARERSERNRWLTSCEAK